MRALFLFSMLLVSSFCFAEAITPTATVPLYAKPDATSRIIEQLQPNQAVNVLQVKEGFAEVESLSDDNIGWIKILYRAPTISSTTGP